MKGFRIIIGIAFAILALAQLAAARAEERPYAWQSVPFGGGGYVPGFVYHPKQPNLLYARTDVGGMYRYDYAAKRWIQLLDHLNRADGDLRGVLSIGLDPNDPNRVYAATGMYVDNQWARKGAILRSSDQGRTWEKSELPIQIGGNSDGRGTGERLAVDPRDGNVIFFGSNRDGLWKSSDRGESFSRCGTPATAITLVAFDPKTNAIYLGSADGRGGLLVSQDGGRSFAPVAGTPNQSPQHMAFGRDGAIYVAYAQNDDARKLNPGNAEAGSVWKRDAAGTWSDITPEKTGESWKFGYSGIDVGPDDTVAVSTLDHWTNGDEIYLSRDGGTHWIGLKDKSHHDLTPWPWLFEFMGGHEGMGSWLSDLKINPFNKDEMIYVGGWVSRNLSEAGSGKPVVWDYWSKDLEESVVLQLVVPVSGKIKVMAAMGDNAGAAWYDIAQPPHEALFKPGRTNNRSVDYASFAPAFIVRSSEEGPSRGYYSDDGGRSWSPFPATPYDPSLGWHSSGVIAVSAKATSLVWVPEKQPAYYSFDKGRTWKRSAGWPTTQHREMVVLSDKAADGVFYVYDNLETVYVSADGGASFQPIITGLKKMEPWGDAAQLAVVPGRLRDLWIATPYGLFHSPDSQTPMSNSPDVKAAWSVGFGAPLKPGGYPAVYLWGQVKKQEGIWRSDDAGESWIRINDDAHQWGGQIAGDMREPGIVYLAPGARGVMVGRPGN